MKKTAGILLLVLLVAAFALPGSADMNKYSTVFMDTFDTVISLIGYAENQETFDARAAGDKLHALEEGALYQVIFRLSNKLRRARRGAHCASAFGEEFAFLNDCIKRKRSP